MLLPSQLVYPVASFLSSTGKSFRRHYRRRRKLNSLQNKKRRRRRHDNVTFSKYRGPTRPSALPVFTVSPPLWSIRTTKRHGTAAGRADSSFISSTRGVRSSEFSLPQQQKAAEQHKSPSAAAALTSFVWAMTASRSWPAEGGPAAANGSRAGGKVSLSRSPEVSRVKWPVAGVNSSQ